MVTLGQRELEPIASVPFMNSNGEVNWPGTLVLAGISVKSNCVDAVGWHSLGHFVCLSSGIGASRSQ